MSKFLTYFSFSILLSVLSLMSCQAQKNFEHVILIGVDGMGTYGIPNAKTPNMDILISNGTYINGNCIMPSSSGPNWTSLFNGTDSNFHGVKNNDWVQSDIKNSTFCGGEKGKMIPTIFKVFRDEHPKSNISVFHDWPKIKRYIEYGVPTIQADCKNEDLTAEMASIYLKKHKPLFTFIHLDNVDHAGHGIGHRTPEYYKSVEKADELIGDIISATKEAGIFNTTLFVITSDHGGKDKSHGGNSPDELNIPIIFSGKGMKNQPVRKNVKIFDIPATILDVMDFKIPKCWQGKTAFKK